MSSKIIKNKIEKIKQTIETDKLIHRFMGNEVNDSMTFCLNSYPYNSQWNWLMPVVRRIVEKCIENDDLFTSDMYTSILDTVPLAILDETYKVVVEFINYYNAKGYE